MRIGGLNQDITYWAPEAENQYGVKTHSTPILIKGRWENKTEQFNTVGGQVIDSQAIIYPDRDLVIDGFLALGDHTGVPEPTALPTAAQIQAFEDMPDLRSCTKVRRAVL